LNVLLLIDKVYSDRVVKYFIEKPFTVEIITNNLSPAYNNYKDYVVSDTLEEKNINKPNLIISYRYWKRIPNRILELANYNTFNFHPAPLPEYRGVKCSTFAIINEETEYGVSLHKMNEKIDEGGIIKVNKFPINDSDTGFSLAVKANEELYSLFVETIGQIIDGSFIINRNKKESGITYTKKMFRENQCIANNANKVDVHKYYRAYHHPRLEGVYCIKNGSKFILTPQLISKLYN
jgi:methionyl-tRNA formyltransferase